jgi:hypothetical protein
MKKNILILIALLPFTTIIANASTCATTIGFDSYSVNIGGISSSIPSAYLKAKQKLNNNLFFSQKFIAGSNASIPGAIYAWALGAGYTDNQNNRFSISPFVKIGSIAIVPTNEPQRISAMYFGAGAKVNYRMFKNINIFAKGSFGRDFGTRINQLNANTIGGLYYGGEIGTKLPTGPGDIDLAYEYQHLPFGDHMTLGVSQYKIGYTFTF